MQEILFILLIVVGFIVVFAVFWTGIVYLISRMGGWASLSEEFPATGRIQGSVFRFCSARFRAMTNYSHCLTVIVSANGLYLEPMLMFRYGHSPILISRRAIVRFERGLLPFYRSTKLTIERRGGKKPATITFYGNKLVVELENWLDNT